MGVIVFFLCLISYGTSLRYFKKSFLGWLLGMLGQATLSVFALGELTGQVSVDLNVMSPNLKRRKMKTKPPKTLFCFSFLRGLLKSNDPEASTTQQDEDPNGDRVAGCPSRVVFFFFFRLRSDVLAGFRASGGVSFRGLFFLNNYIYIYFF